MLFLDLKISGGITLDGTVGITVSAIENKRVILLSSDAEKALAVGEEQRFGALRVVLKSITGNTARIGFDAPPNAVLTPHNWP